eukprot:204974-Alexandrium_andersonii.AAC.1
MSASLVGSEMCIRDRFGILLVRGGLAPTPGPPFPGVRWDFPRVPRARPVSYTHLTLPTICSV